MGGLEVGLGATGAHVRRSHRRGLFSGTLTPKPWLAPGSENRIGRVTNRRIPLKALAFFPPHRPV